MKAFTFPRLMTALVAGVLATSLTACGGGSTDAAPNTDGTLSAGVLRVATLGDAKPYAYTENGTYKGFDVELLQAMAKKLNLKTEFVTQDFSGMLASINNKQFDVGASSIAITEERKKTVVFSDPYYIGYISVMTKKDAGIADEAGLKGKRLGLVQGTIQERYAQQNLPDTDIVRFPDNNAGYSALQSGTIDAQFLDLPVAQDYAAKNDKMSIPVEIPTSDQPAGFAVRKDNAALQGKLNTALKQVVDDGTWLKLYQQYMPTLPVPDQFKPKG